MQSFKTYVNERKQAALMVVELLKSNQFADVKELQEWLEENYEIYSPGEGHFSFVLSETGGKDFVIKIPHDSLKYMEDSWWSFAKVAVKAAEKNPMFPRILYLGYISDGESIPEPIGIAVVEFIRIAPGHGNDERYFDQIIHEHFNGASNEALLKMIEDDVRYKGWYEEKVQQGFDLDTFIDFIERVGNTNNYDIHEENYGVANDGRFVIFDPTSWEE